MLPGVVVGAGERQTRLPPTTDGAQTDHRVVAGFGGGLVEGVPEGLESGGGATVRLGAGVPVGGEEAAADGVAGVPRVDLRFDRRAVGVRWWPDTRLPQAFS